MSYNIHKCYYFRKKIPSISSFPLCYRLQTTVLYFLYEIKKNLNNQPKSFLTTSPAKNVDIREGVEPDASNFYYWLRNRVQSRIHVYQPFEVFDVSYLAWNSNALLFQRRLISLRAGKSYVLIRSTFLFFVLIIP
jgi:hypothetical protein